MTLASGKTQVTCGYIFHWVLVYNDVKKIVEECKSKGSTQLSKNFRP